MDSLKQALRALGVLGLLAGALPLAFALGGQSGLQRELLAVAGPVTGWSFIATGLYLWWRRPENPFGALMTAVGFSACLAALRLSSEPIVFITGLLTIALPFGVLYHMVLAFPRGTLRNRFEVGVVVVAYASAGVVRPVQVLFDDTAARGLPPNPLLVTAAPDVVAAIGRFQYTLGLGLMAILGTLMARRWLEAVPAYRRRLLPVFGTSGVVFALLAVWYAGELGGAPDDWQRTLETGRVIGLAVVPFGFLAGLLHSRVAGAAAVTDLLTRFGNPVPDGHAVRAALARALGDPGLELAYWLPDEGRYVDVEGRAVELPPDGGWRATTIVERDGRRVGAFIHDATLFQTPELLRAATAAVALTLDNARLHAELRARLDELSRSRARVVRAADDERRRIERNLHDGTQQRLTSVAMALGLAESRLGSDPAAARDALSQARAGLAVALAELRNLSQGIHPGILTERGLGAAIEDLAYASPMPIRVSGAIDGRLDEAVEAAAYYVVAEALANVTKHARASSVEIALDHRSGGGQLRVAICDDGVGGADVGRGTGLKGLADRVHALGGALTVESGRGEGTRVEVVLPCG